MPPTESEQQQICRQRIGQVFDFLKALNEHRNPAVRRIQEQPWLMWLDDLPDHSSIELPSRFARSPNNDQGAELSADAHVLRVRRPTLTLPPPAPEEIRGWLRAGWDDPERDVECLESENHIDDQGETVTVRFDDDPQRPAALSPWRQDRDAWREAEIPARRAMHVFERLYALYGRLQRESERFDLVVGDGLLSWHQQDGNIYHPLLIQRVQLVFNPRIPEFTVVDADFGSELQTGLFQAISEVDPRMLAARRTEFAEGGYHPLSAEVTAFLEGLVNQLASQGVFVGKRRPDPASPHPSIGRAPVLFLRSRTRGFGTAIEQVIRSMESREEFCGALRNIVGCETSPYEDVDDGQKESTYRELPQEDVLFGKEANPEQIRIARQLDRHGAVLVQGPPGTGKSHTIANLIGHLLAHGKSVLVTSHTTKALRVLRGHVVEELRPLCVSVLENDLDSRRQLEESVQAISSRLSESDAEELDREAESLARRREQLLQELRQLQMELLHAREDEYRDIVVAGKAYAPCDAARRVAAGKGGHDWIPSPIALGEPLPLSTAEVCELYATNASTQPEDEKHADTPLPEPKELLLPEEFERFVTEIEELSEGGPYEKRLWPAASFTTRHIEQIRALGGEFRETVAEFKRLEGWQLAAVDAGRVTTGDLAPWEHLLGKTDETARLARDAQLELVTYRPEVRDDPPLEIQRTAATEIRGHVSAGGKLGRLSLAFRPKWKESLNCWRVQGRTPATVEEVAAVERLLSIKIARAELTMLWDGLMTPHGAPPCSELGGEPEKAAAQFAAQIRNCLQWWNNRWRPLVERLRGLGFDWERFLGEQAPDLSPYGELNRAIRAVGSQLLADLERTASFLQSLHLKRQVREILLNLEKYDRPEVAELGQAIERSEVDLYRRAYTRCVDAANRRKDVLKRQLLLSRLARSAERWAHMIRNRIGSHAGAVPPGDVADPWEWRQLNDELDRRARVDLEKLGEKIADLQFQLKNITNQLIDRRAWAGQVRRTSLRQRQALMRWLGIVRRRGKGFTKRDPQLRRAAQQKMEECRDAVPVWIMPLARLVETFDFGEPRFDVVIIDEASQCDVMALLAWALARKVVIVGDDKQVSPLAVGQKLDIVENLIRLHLDGIPNAVLYDGRMSVYDLAKQSFPGLICLLEHFRCVPDIIQFSNHLCYDGNIKPLREDASSPIRPHVVPYRVAGICDSRNVNQEEALAVASLVVAAVEHEAYEGLTFGVISLLGEEQAMAIEQLLLQHLTPEEYERRRIICGNSAHFQGDERDVMFLSMVHTSSGGPLRLLDSTVFQQRFNVAASRARNQMWLAYSVNPGTDLKPGDLRRRLIEHCLDPAALVRELERASQRTQSPFEKQVLERLVNRGYRVRPQWAVGRYRIDLVVEGAGKRLAIECDGDRYHPIEKLPEDMERQAILERLGWRFLRLRGSTFFRDPEATMGQVFRRLEELGIAQEGIEQKVPETAHPVDDLVEELVRRAAEIRDDWRTPQSREAEADAVQPSEESSGEDQAVLWDAASDEQLPEYAAERESVGDGTVHDGNPWPSEMQYSEGGLRRLAGALRASKGSEVTTTQDAPTVTVGEGITGVPPGQTDEESAQSATDVDGRPQKTWEEMFAALARYEERHGNCDVPADWPEDPELARWVVYQRRRWAHGGEGGKDKLTGQQSEKLRELGFKFYVE